MTQPRPQGLNTVKLLKVGSQSFGCGAHETLKIAEGLYLRGFTTYPRTESTTFSNNFNFKEVLSALKEHHEFGEYAGGLLKNGYEKPRKGVDAGDHPPITPVRAARPGELGDRERQVYEYITCTFLACISKDARYSGIRTELLIGGEEKFKIKGQVLQDSGFLDIMPWQRHADKEIPVYQVGDIVDVKSTGIVEGRTAPPGFLTEADLIA
jgi:DNA topoisomerase III|tara:strand:+ start:2222 stop:2851 length:630 start_codon:yes stop_codon:yes gene_type:complete